MNQPHAKPLHTRREALRIATTGGTGLLVAPTFAVSEPRPLRVAGRPVELTVTPISPKNVRVTLTPIERDQPQPLPSDGALVRETWGPPVLRLRHVGDTRQVRCGDLTVEVSLEPLMVQVQDKRGRRVQQLAVDGANGEVRFLLGADPVFGLGQGGPQFDRRGHLHQMRSGQAGYNLRTHGGKVPIQWLIGTAGWAIYLHWPLGRFDLTGSEGRFLPASPESALPLDVFIIGDSDPATLLREYAVLTGFPEMIPLWSLGYQQSHRTLDPPEEILQEAKLFRQKQLPCDVMIYLGTGFCPNGWNTFNGEFVWNTKAFPDPERMIRQLQADHFKVVLHIVLEGRRLTGTVKDPCTAPGLPTGRTADGRWPEDRQVSCYWPAHKPLLDAGVDGWWVDQGDGLDAPSRLARIRMYFEGHQVHRPNERVYALHRNGYAGMQRYAAFLWSGDVQSRWETLKTHVSVAINTGLSGIPYWGTDIGGFVPTEELTGELYVRWFQFGAFCPLFRSHGRNWKLRLPWGWNLGTVGFPEVDNYNPDPKELRNPHIEPICKKYLELRYQLMPYLYSLVRETCESGIPIIRALWLHYPDDSSAVIRGDEYLWGRDILVAPVVEKGATSRSLYLPRGTWYDFWTQERLQGGREINRPVDLATLPLYARAGAVIPMGPVKQHTEQQTDEPLTLHIYPGADGRFVLYEDDGKTFNFRKGEFMKVNVVWDDRRRRLSLALAAGSKLLPPRRRRIRIRVVGEAAEREVVFEGRSLEVSV